MNIKETRIHVTFLSRERKTVLHFISYIPGNAILHYHKLPNTSQSTYLYVGIQVRVCTTCVTILLASTDLRVDK